MLLKEEGESNMFLNEARINEVKDILYHCYQTDVSFPRSCGTVSMVLAYLFELSDLSDEYEITYERGHYRNENEEEWCEELSLDFQRGDNLENFPCFNCNCDYMVGHSWIELVSKIDQEIFILDFTSIQFEEDFGDYHEELLDSDHDKDSLYDYISRRSKFVIDNTDWRFNHYINSERTRTGKELVRTVKETIEENCTSMLTVTLERMGYLPTND